MPGFAFPAVGPLGLRSPRSRPPSPAPSVLRSAKTASALLEWLRLSLATRYSARLLCFVSRSRGSPSTRRLACGARALVPPVPLVFRLSLAKRQEALPSSRVTPVCACPALRPRWCPWCSPYRPRDYCLPPVAQRRLSHPPSSWVFILAVHDFTYFGVQLRGLHSRYTRFRTPHLWDRPRVRY